MPTREEELLLKRNTDCVYFLASPLTCKKGMDCEYRHSEVARLNPRDCWYWLSSSCLNPACGFRHPPVDKHLESPSDSSSLSYQSSVPVSKTSIPCYFYLNGFCLKGDRCFYMHGTDGDVQSMKPVKTSSAVNSLPSDNKASIGNHIIPLPAEVHLNPSENALNAVVDIECQPKEDVHQPAPRSMIVQSPSRKIAVSHNYAASLFSGSLLAKSDSVLPRDNFIQSKFHMPADQSSGEHMDDHIEAEERLESSPGFDVLVNGEPEGLVYKEDPDYSANLYRERRELNTEYLSYDLEDSDEYDHIYANAKPLYHGEIHGVGRDYVLSEDMILDSLLAQNRKLLPMELAINDHRSVDLRDHLRKRRVIDGRTFVQSSRRHISSHLLGQRQEWSKRHAISHRLHGRLTIEVGKHATGPCRGSRTFSNTANFHGWFKHPQSKKFRWHYKAQRLGRRQFLSSEVCKKSVRKERSTQATTVFTGPKTLAQIKEEKKKAEETGDYTGKKRQSGILSVADFEGPKPLNEILKEKRMPVSVMDFNTDDN